MLWLRSHLKSMTHHWWLWQCMMRYVGRDWSWRIDSAHWASRAVGGVATWYISGGLFMVTWHVRSTGLFSSVWNEVEGMRHTYCWVSSPILPSYYLPRVLQNISHHSREGRRAVVDVLCFGVDSSDLPITKLSNLLAIQEYLHTFNSANVAGH